MKQHSVILGGTTIAIVAVVIAATVGSPYRILYNPSQSAPPGWYGLVPAARFEVGTMVFARLPPNVARYAADRGYLPRTVPILKRIGASAGYGVCEIDGALKINGELVGHARDRDGLGRMLMPWRGCRRLDADEVFLLGVNGDVSFDSRYFGPVQRNTLIGRAVPLWMR